MRINEITQKVFEPVEIAKGVFIAGNHIKDDRNAFHKKFDKDGKLVYKHTMQPSYNSISEFEYDEKNNLITETVYSEEQYEFYRSEHFTYNESGLLVSKKSVMAEKYGGKPSYTNYFYDSKGRQIKVNHYTSGEFLYSELITYDDSGFYKTVNLLNRVQKLTKVSEFLMNEIGQTLEIRQKDGLNPSGVLFKYYYDDFQRLKELVLTKGAALEHREVYEYDLNGNLISTKRFKEHPEKLVHFEQNIFEYDDNQEWNSMKSYINNKIKIIIEREVKYFT